MSSSPNIHLTNEPRRYIDSQASDEDVYTTPSESIRDPIRHDMQDWQVVNTIRKGLNEAADGVFVSESIIVPNED
ncbi:MAG: hypothetical protein J7647_26070 [Cyanobacteria bacterium SBLK]|nr:hypothetical protein [Cyanobacteria bacterium SBLK]